ncbi:hypothetical protein A5658_23355 [Mycobacterium sp. 1245111.1]|nr:hypothetical protein A5658_23355 [Mycobacterium sp. 1245111.1]
MKTDLRGRVVAITGGARGIGLATAKAFAAVVAATRNHRAVSYVPRRMQFLLRTALFTPQRPRRFLGRVTRTDRVFLAMDQATRDAYHARAVAAE